MRALGICFFFVSTAAVLLASAGRARAADAPPAASSDASTESEFGSYVPPPVATVRGHAYTLVECLALSDRNHPNLWAARARVANAHAQLDEVKWFPFWQWYASSNFGVLGPITGTVVYTSSPASVTSLNVASTLQPAASFDLSGSMPLYTFGKISAGRSAAEAQVRYFEWDMEKFRQQVRMDVRRAYFGLMLSRDARYIVRDAMDRLNRAIDGLTKKIEQGDSSVEEIDKIRLEVYRDEINAKLGEAERGETYALAALRFLTGTQTAFDIPDEPLKRPDTPLGPVVRYLAAARLFRPEVAMSRAGIAARTAQLELARARLFPDIGLGVSGSYAISPSATMQNAALIPNPFNHFAAGAGLGLRWSLDILPQTARIAQAESQLEETRALERFALGGIGVEVENAYAVVLEAKNREESWDRAEHKAKQWISTVQDAIDLGTKDERAMNEPIRVYLNARVNHMYALMDYNVAQSDLSRASGWDAAAPTSN